MTQRTITADVPTCPVCLTPVEHTCGRGLTRIPFTVGQETARSAAHASGPYTVLLSNRRQSAAQPQEVVTSEKVLIARAWSWPSSWGLQPIGENQPIVVSGLTEPALRELVERRGVCEWHLINHVNDDRLWVSGSGYPGACDVSIDGIYNQPIFCPSCGRKVVVK